MSKPPKRKAESDGTFSIKKGKKDHCSSPGSPPVKRSKRDPQVVEERQGNGSSPEKDIQSVRELNTLLASTRLDVDELIQRLTKFKSFLGPIAFAKSDETSPNVPMLVDYLKSQISVDDEDCSRLVPDIVKIAHHAGEIKSDALYASAVTTISLLLKAISGLHEMRQPGNSLCRLILHQDHIHLIARGMSAAKPKEHLISPCLRLLREMVLFDGGRAARGIYRQRHVTFQRLEVFLTMRGAKNDDDSKARKRLSVRNNAISYLLVNLRLQSQTAKSYILGRNKWTRALLSDMGSDPPGLVHTVLDTLRKDVAEDRELPLIVKGRFFDDWALHQLATLYGFKNDAPEDGKLGIRDLTHSLLQTILVSDEHGLLLLESRSDNGPLEQNDSDSDERAAVHGPGDVKKIRRNLISFVKHLRPYASVPQTDLVLSCFQLFPELLQDYFSDKMAFSFEPKLTATWIGYSQFIQGIIQQPLPESLVHRCLSQDGQPIDLLLDHILPPPLTQKVLTRCFNQNSDLIKFFASQTLVTAFDKIASVRKVLDTLTQARFGVTTESEVNVLSQLSRSFAQRLPSLRDVATQLRSCPDTAVMLRESLLRLLVHYYSSDPALVLEGKFDISILFSNSLTTRVTCNGEGKKDGILTLIQEHLVAIAFRSTSIQWFHKSESTPSTPFTCLLKACVEDMKNGIGLKDLLESLMVQNYLIWPNTEVTGLDIFVRSLQTMKMVALDAIYAFIDNCIMRCEKKTVVYSDLLDNLVNMIQAKGERIPPGLHADLLLITIMEQLPYLTARQDEAAIEPVARFLKTYLDFSLLRGISRPLLILVRDTMKVCFEKYKDCFQLIEKALEEPLDGDIQRAFNQLISEDKEDDQQSIAPLNPNAEKIQEEAEIPPGPPIEDKDHHGLVRWTRRDIQDAIADGAVAELFLCLCSEFEEIRKQALTGVGKLMQKLEFSSYSEWRQVRLLVGELRETASNAEADDGQLPYVAGVFATHMLRIINDPLHFLYKKVNNFLNKGPQWTVEKLPSYWTDKILLRPPTTDDSHYLEIQWLLDVLTDALRTSKDMDIYRQSQILEKIMTLAASPQISATCYEKIIDLLFRCTCVEGSTTLITRCGLTSWIDIHVAKTIGLLRSKLILLGRRAYELSDQTYVNEWSRNDFPAALAKLGKSAVFESISIM